jgi:hypothetical protein
MRKLNKLNSHLLEFYNVNNTKYLGCKTIKEQCLDEESGFINKKKVIEGKFKLDNGKTVIASIDNPIYISKTQLFSSTNT